MTLFIFILRYAFVSLFLVMLGVCALAGFRNLLMPKWLVRLTPVLRKCSNAVLPLTLCFALVFIFKTSIFPFASATHDLNTFKGYYEQTWFFLLRSLIYLAMAGWVSFKLKNDQTVHGTLTLIFVLFFGSFAAYDWVLSQSQDFHSTIFGLLLIINGTLIVHAMGLATLEIEDGHPLLLDLNTVFLATIALWSYLALMQYITVWSGNLPIEVAYFKSRFHGWMGLIASVCLAGQALIPIPLLLFKSLKRRLKFTRAIAIYTLVIQSLQIFWLLGGMQ